MLRQTRTSKKLHCRKGATTVEFAFVAPVIFLIFVGALEMSNLNFVRNMANDAAYQVARQAVVPGADDVAIVASTKSLLQTAGVTQVDIQITETLDKIAVSVSVPLNANSWGLGKFIANQSIVQACTMAKQIKGLEDPSGT